MIKRSDLLLYLGGAGVALTLLHWIYTRRERRTLKEECRGAALREMKSARAYIASMLENPDNAKVFRRQVALVRDSWQKLKPNRLEKTAHVMYDRLLEEDPSTRDVFDATLDWSSQERIFIIMVGNLISKLDEPTTDALLETLTRLGKRHHEVGVKPQQYSSMQRAILSSLEELLGDEWDPETEAAWASVFSFISHTMIKAAHETSESSNQLASPGGAEITDREPLPNYTNKYITVLKDDVGATDGRLLHRRTPSAEGNRIVQE